MATASLFFLLYIYIYIFLNAISQSLHIYLSLFMIMTNVPYVMICPTFTVLLLYNSNLCNYFVLSLITILFILLLIIISICHRVNTYTSRLSFLVKL